MAINLKEISLLDNDSIKLDKVNYNFDQIVANGGGPVGSQGSVGSTGYQGLTGHQGDAGIVGDQGFQGDAGIGSNDIWKVNEGSSSKTILPVHDSGDANPPTIAVGYRSTDQFYDTGESNSSLLINRDSVVENNLELRSEGEGPAFYYKLSGTPTEFNMSTGFRSAGSSTVDYTVNQYADKWIWHSESTVAPVMSLDNTDGLVVNAESRFNQPVNINNTLKIGGTVNTPDVGKIAVSGDNVGTIDFKSIDEIGGVVPIGTIVSVDPAFFTNSNFILTESAVTAPSDEPIQIRVGSGINNFAGWYLCNGQEWVNNINSANPSYLSYQTEDLNSFSYSIDENPSTTNPNSQGEVTVSNTETNIIGGANISMLASYSSPTYTVTTPTISTSTQSITSDSGGTIFVLKKLPQIVYLGTEDLFWHDKGTNQAAPVAVIYRFTDSNEGAGGLATINEVKTEVEGSSFSFSVNIAAPSGYEWGSLPTVSADSANGPVSSSTASNPGGTLPTQSITINVSVSSQPQGGTVSLTYDSTNHISAIATRTASYRINPSSQASWSAQPSSQNKTATPGDTVNLSTFTLTLPNDEYFDPGRTPFLPYTYIGNSGTQQRTNDFTVTSHSYSDTQGNISLKPRVLDINIQDTDFADSSSVAGGSTELTTINIGGTKIYSTVPYIRYTNMWTGSNNTWNATNYNQYSTTSNRTWLIQNGTQEQVNLRLEVSEYTGASSSGGVSAQISASGETTQNAFTGSSSVSSGPSSVDYSNSTWAIPAGGSINVTWNLSSVPSNQGWSASLNYWLGTGNSPGLLQESKLTAKIIPD